MFWAKCYIFGKAVSKILLLAGDLSKFGRGDASSPAPATTLAQPQQTQTQTHHTTQQPFLNPALPPGYSYTSLPYYTGVPGLPNTFQYGPAMFPVRVHKVSLHSQVESALCLLKIQWRDTAQLKSQTELCMLWPWVRASSVKVYSCNCSVDKYLWHLWEAINSLHKHCHFRSISVPPLKSKFGIRWLNMDILLPSHIYSHVMSISDELFNFTDSL